MTKYKVGDEIRILKDKEYGYTTNEIYKAGEIYTITGLDEEGDPWFEGDKNPCSGWPNDDNWFEKIEKPALSHKYRVGDNVRVLDDIPYIDAPNGKYLKGKIYEVIHVTRGGGICLTGDKSLHYGWEPESYCFEKVEG